MKDERGLWFKFVPGMMEAVKHSSNRELAIFGGVTVRFLRSAKLNFLQKIISQFDLDTKKCTFYNSLDRYKFIPMFTSNLQKRTKETQQWLSETTPLGADFGIDIDYKNGTWRDSIPEVEELLKLFEKSGVKFAYWCSLGHGFHFVIPFEEVEQVFKGNYKQLIAFYTMMAEILKTKFPNIDMSAYMQTRVFKAPYLLNDKDEVVLPLFIDDFEKVKQGNFSFTPSWIINNIKVQNRGVFINGQPGNFKKFVEEVERL